MAYNPYTADQINSEVDRLGIGNDPWALLAHARKNNADPMAVAAARGIDPAAAQQWLTGAQQQLAGPIANTRGLADSNPYMAYNLAQQRGYTADQAGSLFGKAGSDINSWLGSTGLSLGQPSAAPSAPSLQVGGTPTPVANTPQQYPGGAMPAAPAAMPGGAAPAGNPYMQQTQRPANPYMPAGGQGSNGQNDPRMGMPSTGNQGFGGLGDYLWQNPSTMAMGNELARQSNNNLFRNVLPQIRGNAMASGTVGGSRQGVAEGLGIGEAMAALAGAQANLYGNQFNQDRGYGLQSDSLDYNIHRGNLQDMRQGQLDQVNFLNQMTQWGQQGVGMANQTRDRPFTDWQRFVQPASQMAGLGGQTTQQLSGNPYAGVIGGWAAGQKMYGG